MTVGGGLRYPGATLEPPPLFTLYGDGRVIYATATAVRPDGAPGYDLQQAQLTEEQATQLLLFALDEGGLANARARYDDIPIADDMTTWFDVRVDAVSKTVAVYALDYAEPPVPDAEMRSRFRALSSALLGFAGTVHDGQAVDLGRFEPDAYLVTLDEPFGPMANGPARPWPWDDLEPADFEVTQAGWREAVISADQAMQLADPLSSIPDDYIVEAPTGEMFLVRIRPLLPDQVP